MQHVTTQVLLDTLTDNTKTTLHPLPKEYNVAGYVTSLRDDFSNARTELMKFWMLGWASYLGTPQSSDWIRMNFTELVGNVGKDWRHKINRGKAFYVVETLHSHLMAATFPNNDWFGLEPQAPDMHEYARMFKKYLKDRLFDWRFRTHYASFLRQLLVCGTSVFALPWSNRQNQPGFRILNMFDVFLDPTAEDPNESDFIRTIWMTKAEIYERIASKEFQLDRRDLENNLPTQGTPSVETYMQDNVETFAGINSGVMSSKNQKIPVYEFWGNLEFPEITFKNVIITVVNGHVARVEKNPYHIGKPFIIGQYIPIPFQAYPLSSLQPIQGQIQEMDNIVNQRLDNMELASNLMGMYIDDGVINEEDLYLEPGKMIRVADLNSFQFLNLPTQQLNITYQEEQVLDSYIDKSAGTTAGVGASQMRQAERVTAEEVSAVRESGGVRITNVHTEMEESHFIPLLVKVIELCAQYSDKDYIVSLPIGGVNEYTYYKFGKPELALRRNVKIIPQGSAHVVETQRYIEKRMSFLELVAQSEQMMQMIDLNAILYDLLQNWGFEDPEKYLKQQEPMQQQQGNIPSDPLQRMGGQGLRTALQQGLAADGGQQFLRDTTGQQLPDGVTLNDVIARTEAAGNELDSITRSTLGGGQSTGNTGGGYQ